MKYFVEYLTPFTGLFPVGTEASVVGAAEPVVTTVSAGGVPRAITALLQGSYWTSLAPSGVFAYSYIIAVLWLLMVIVASLVTAFVMAPQFASARGLSPRLLASESESPLPAGDGLFDRARAMRTGASRSVLKTALLWTLGRLVAVHSFVYYVLCVSTVFQLWTADFVEVTAWIVGCCVLLLPVACVLKVTRSRHVVVSALTTNSATQLALGPLVSSFRSGYVWFGCAVLLDRLLFAVIVVTASPRPMLQLLLVVTRSLLWLLLVHAAKPYRNSGVQRLSVLLAVFRPVILCLSIMFIPSAASDDGAFELVYSVSLCVCMGVCVSVVAVLVFIT